MDVLDIAMLVLAAAAFVLFGRYLLACERG
jgi:hypothetical protein